MRATLHTPETIYTPRHVPSWLLLAAAAGFVNGFAFLVCQQFVTHVTGIATRLGLEWLHFGIAAEYTAVFLSFVVGATAAVLLLELRAGGTDRWATPLIVVALLLAVVAVVGHLGGLESLGSQSASDPPPVVLLSLLSFAAGMQNAAVAATTGMSVRTTHLTGPTTDLGMLVGTAMLSRGKERRDALAGAGLRAGIVLAFVVGGVLSLFATGGAGYLALLVPAIFVLAAGVLSFVPEWSPGDYPSRTAAA